MPISEAGQRVIGIRHTLRKLKQAGLVEQDSLFPEQAVRDVQDEVRAAAQRWYRIGAKRGALEVLEALLGGHLAVHTDKQGKREIITSKSSLKWTKALNVRVGKSKQRVPDH